MYSTPGNEATKKRRRSVQQDKTRRNEAKREKKSLLAFVASMFTTCVGPLLLARQHLHLLFRRTVACLMGCLATSPKPPSLTPPPVPPPPYCRSTFQGAHTRAIQQNVTPWHKARGCLTLVTTPLCLLSSAPSLVRSKCLSTSQYKMIWVPSPPPQLIGRPLFLVVQHYTHKNTHPSIDSVTHISFPPPP